MDINKTIFVVTTVRSLNNIRTVAWYEDFSTAEKAVLSNNLDIYEFGQYPFVVIEEIKQGTYPEVVGDMWYRWEGGLEKGCYKPIERPEPFKRIVNWGIG